jgi:hypothetical protein
MACGGDDDDDDTGGTSGGGAGSTAAGSTAAGSTAAGSTAAGSGSECKKDPSGSANMCLNQGDVNLDCPEQPPTDGVCASSGACCHRASNKTKEGMLCADDPLVLEYRLNFSLTKNHPTTIGDPLLVASSTARYDQEQQSILWRFEAPRKEGKEIDGMGKTTIGVGRYNCDGTYSYYDDKAAPSKPMVSEDVARWKPRTVTSQIDTTKTGRDRMHIKFADNMPGRGLVYTPFLDDSGAMLDWELVNEGYDITAIDTSGEGRDCIGSRTGTTWKAGGTFEVYTPLPENDKEQITLISQTYCQLVAFGILPTDKKTTVLCDTPRCMPGSDGCSWKKLPDSLCPSDDTERALYGCHLGDKDGVNMEEGYPSADMIKCTAEKPTAAADPDMGTTGQCCDPMGMSQTLPPCNAYRLIQDYVAAAAEITDSLADKVQQKCMAQ